MSLVEFARLEARRGLYADAMLRLESLDSEAQTPQRKTALLGAQSEVVYAQGQVQRAIEINRALNEAAKATMPPTLRMLSVEAQMAILPDRSFVTLG